MTKTQVYDGGRLSDLLRHGFYSRLSRLSGISRRHVAKICDGLSSPSLPLAGRLLDAANAIRKEDELESEEYSLDDLRRVLLARRKAAMSSAGDK